MTEDVSARFAPSAGNPVALTGNVTGQIEFVTIAGATQILLQTEAAVVDLVVGLASNSLSRPVGKSDRAIPGPRAVETAKRSRLGVSSRCGQHECGADSRSLDSLSK